jgi:glycosyltransferase involved in cell wall biosynthesis
MRSESGPAPEARRRLVYVVHSLDPGGTERLVTNMALAFRDQYDVRVICLDLPGRWADLLRRQSIPVHCVYRQARFDPAVPLRIARLARRWHADILHAHQYTPWFYAALSRLVHAPPRLLFEEHGRFHPEVENTRRVWINRLLLRRLTHASVAVSADIRERLVRYEGLRREDISVIYNGTAPATAMTTEARAALRATLGASPGDVLVGTVGRFDPIKNLPMLVRAFSDAARTAPRLKLVLIGDGPERGSTERAVSDAGIRDRVHFTGFRDDARVLTQALDLFVLTSWSEGTSMALLEAMSAGVPGAVTTVGGNPEIVREGITGWLVASDDSKGMAGVMNAVAANPNLAAQRGTSARADFDERFRFQHMIEQYAERYDALLRAPGAVLHKTVAAR